MPTVTATDLARNTREILDKITSQGASIDIERNHVMIARIVPPEQFMTAEEALHGLRPMLTKKQASAWLKDSKGNFDPKIRDPWE